MANIFVDETSDKLALGAGMEDAGTFNSDVFIGGSALAIGDGSVSLSFHGTSAVFYGLVSGETVDAKGPDIGIIVNIDDRDSFVTNVRQQTAIVPFFTTPTLNEGNHNVTLSTPSNILLDYMVVTAGKTTPLAGEQLIVDDSDPAVKYTGLWTRNQSALFSPTETRLPFGNATQQTTALNASVLFSFTGSAISVVGESNTGPGALGLQFTFDGVVFPVVRFAPLAVPNTNFKWYAGSFTPGNHTIQIQVAEAPAGAAFVLDYFMYTPSFASLADQSGSANRAGATGTASDPAATATGGPPSRSGATGSGSGRVAFIGIVFGVVLGVISLLVIASIVACRMKRSRARKQKRQEDPVIVPFKAMFPSHKENASAATSTSTVQTQQQNLPEPTPEFSAQEKRSPSMQKGSRSRSRSRAQDEGAEGSGSGSASGSTSVRRDRPALTLERIPTSHTTSPANTSASAGASAKTSAGTSSQPSASSSSAGPPRRGRERSGSGGTRTRSGGGRSGSGSGMELRRERTRNSTRARGASVDQGNEGAGTSAGGLPAGMGGGVGVGVLDVGDRDSRWDMRSITSSTVPPPYEPRE
ncbi:hypothetical protein H0H81_010351 [Sphagnurus paluster]|uniref:Transmembrane protein n=1 Tax=Sphagnurus paluster TaxID=117069 RepID=A0A9P7FT05_9AGAR|nr:hypothetical protein H0H81_010351 [Sphagnurus paluster]